MKGSKVVSTIIGKELYNILNFLMKREGVYSYSEMIRRCIKFYYNNTVKQSVFNGKIRGFLFVFEEETSKELINQLSAEYEEIFSEKIDLEYKDGKMFNIIPVKGDVNIVEKMVSAIIKQDGDAPKKSKPLP